MTDVLPDKATQFPDAQRIGLDRRTLNFLGRSNCCCTFGSERWRVTVLRDA
jgi:hypothetical protein